MDPYIFALALHSWLRWLVLILALISIFRGITGWTGKKDWTKSDTAWASRFAMIISIQLVIGLFLLFISPGVQNALSSGMAVVMKNDQLRMILIEHPFGMLVSVALVHIGKSKARKASSAVQSHKRATIFFLIAMVVMLASIPWGTAETFRGF